MICNDMLHYVGLEFNLNRENARNNSSFGCLQHNITIFRKAYGWNAEKCGGT